MAQATLAAISHGSLETNDAVVAVVAIMRDDGYQEGEHVEIQRECCRMMAELTAGNACTEAVLASDAASMLVRAMMSLGQARGFWLALGEHAPSTLTPHPHTNPNPPRHKDAAVQWQGCRALTNLSCGGDECRKAVRDAGGANALMLAMEMHPEDLPLARLRLVPCIARTHARPRPRTPAHLPPLCPHALAVLLQAQQGGRALRGLASGGIEGVRALLEARATRCAACLWCTCL